MKSVDLIRSVIGYLNAHADYALLRNYEGLPFHNSSRDIDIVLYRDDWRKIRKELIKIIDGLGWKLIILNQNYRIHTWVVSYQEDNNLDIIQWDFFFGTSVYGIELMSAKELLTKREYNGFLYFVSKEAAFLDKYLYNRGVGAQFPEKYNTLRHEIEQNDYVKNKLKKVYGTKDCSRCDNLTKMRLLSRALVYNMIHNPILQLRALACFWFQYVSNYVRSKSGFSVGFTGPDGSGKTTVIHLLIQNLGSVFHSTHKLFHFRPSLFANLSEVAYAAGMTKEVDRNYHNPHRGRKTGMINSLSRLVYYSFDYIVGNLTRIKTVVRGNGIVIFDRYYTDIMADSRRSRIYLPLRFLYWFGKLFIPSLDYNILLTASAEHILARKRELDEDGIRSINEKLDYLAGKPGYKLFLNEGTPQQAVHAILAYLFAEQHKKNLKRLGMK